MDRIIANPQKKQLIPFEYLDLFPYTIAVFMICAEVYILHQFVVVSHMLQH